jgi:hypothetical protein
MDGVNGRQWLFLTQGVPASILGIVAYLYLQDKPEDAQWLDAREKKVLRDHLEHDKGLIAGASYGSMWQMLKDPKVHTLALVYFLLLGATYTMVFWLPTLIKSWGIKDLFMIGIYAAVPSLFGVAAMVFIGRSSDRREEAPLALLLVRHAGRGGPGHHHLYPGQLRRFDDRAVHRHRRHRLGHATVLHRHIRVSAHGHGHGRGRHRADQQPGQPGCGGQPVAHRRRHGGHRHVPGDRLVRGGWGHHARHAQGGEVGLKVCARPKAILLSTLEQS